jgi:hypothetical protein
MERYANLGGDSGVHAFELGAASIVIQFVERPASADRFYRYTNASAGAAQIREMRRLAEAGQGLSTYIARHDPGYESKW